MTLPGVLFSVVIPTYNYVGYLARALDSVLVQWAEDVELVVVDDGSTDGTRQLLDGYAAKYPFIRIVYQDNAGAAAARNKGISLSRGRFILPLDADDELLPDALAILRATLAANPDADLVIGAYVSVGDDGRERLRFASPVPRLPAKTLARYFLLDKRIAICHSCTVFRRELLLQRLYPQGIRSGEDIPVFAYVLVHGKTVVTHELIARIHKHSDSLRNSRHNEQTALDIVREVFVTLPVQCQSLRSQYEAQRYLSLFRIALRADDRAAAQRFYWRAFALSPLQAMRWTYLRRVPRLLFKR